MRDKEKDALQMAIKRNDFLAKSYKLFTEKNIESVSMIEIAEVCGYGTTTLYRYFPSKPKLVVAVAVWKWEQFREENKKRKPDVDFDRMTAAEIFEFYLDSFLELYRKHDDLLRFTQFFNVYVRAEHIDAMTLQPYQDMIRSLRERFHDMYTKAELDKTMRTDVSEEEMFSTTLHLMLAAVTRYAMGLVYIPESGFDPEKELTTQKNAIMMQYRNDCRV